MDRPLRIGNERGIPLAEIELGASRASGPGGQHANVTASRIEAVFDVAASQALRDEQKRPSASRCGPRVTAAAQAPPSQARNRELALERLRQRLATALHVPRSRRATKPTKASKERRIQQKRPPGERKQARRRPSAADE